MARTLAGNMTTKKNTTSGEEQERANVGKQDESAMPDAMSTVCSIKRWEGRKPSTELWDYGRLGQESPLTPRLSI